MADTEGASSLPAADSISMRQFMPPAMPSSILRREAVRSSAGLLRSISHLVSCTERTRLSYSLESRSIILRIANEAEIFPFRSSPPPKSIRM